MTAKSEFEEWLLAQGRKPRTASSYAGAVASKLSTLAREHRIIDVPLLEYAGSRPLERVVHEIRELDEFKASDARGKGMYGAALRQLVSYRSLPETEALLVDLDLVRAAKDIGETERTALVQARLGQGDYRAALVSLWGRCAVTGYAHLPMLVASHLKPWNTSTNRERLDPHNGFLLIPTLDKAFDRGYVTFADNGRIRISDDLEHPAQLSIDPSLRAVILEGNRNYLAYHREVCFRR